MTIKLLVITLIVSSIIILMLISYLSWYFASMIAQPRGGKCSQDHFVFCGGPAEIGLAFEEVNFANDIGLTLKGWFIPAARDEKTSPTIVMIHGFGASRHEHTRWFKSLHAAGFNIFCFDLRNAGESDRRFTSMGFYEKNDVFAALDYLETTRDLHRFGIFGVSMGGATAIMAMASDQRIEVGVFEATFSNLNRLFGEILRRDYHLPTFPILPLANLILQIRYKIPVAKINPMAFIGQIAPRPVLIMHCDQDPYVEPHHGQANYAAAGEPKRLWLAPRNMHAEAWQADPIKAEALITSTYKQILLNAPI